MGWSPYASLCRHCGAQMTFWTPDEHTEPWLCCTKCDLPAGAFAHEPSVSGSGTTPEGGA